jgi:hypothetical protein
VAEALAAAGRQDGECAAPARLSPITPACRPRKSAWPKVLRSRLRRGVELLVALEIAASWSEPVVGLASRRVVGSEVGAPVLVMHSFPGAWLAALRGRLER